MNWHNKIKSILVLVAAIGMLASYSFTVLLQDPIAANYPKKDKLGCPPSVQLYYAIEKYAPQYGVPKRIAYNVAKHETGYEGPLDWDYNPALESSTGAVGPMQVLLSTGRMMGGDSITKSELKHNVDLNVRLSMKLLSRLHKQYGQWDVALGYYNTGYPVVNDYAREIVKNPVKIKTQI